MEKRNIVYEDFRDLLDDIEDAGFEFCEPYLGQKNYQEIRLMKDISLGGIFFRSTKHDGWVLYLRMQEAFDVFIERADVLEARDLENG